MYSTESRQLNRAARSSPRGAYFFSPCIARANPPYYQEKTITDAAKKISDIYSYGGLGIEALFLSWIITALKENGIANVILPDGIFSNMSNKKLKEHLLNACQILSIISLPVGTFFNTPKKTYILTLRKKTQNEINNHTCDHYEFFSYICNSIGETLDNYRFDTPNDNDLREAANKYIVYRNLYDKPDMYEMLKNSFDADKKMKILNVEDFFPEKSWIIENWWTDEEKISIGLKKEQQKVKLEEFNIMIDNAVAALINYKEAMTHDRTAQENINISVKEYVLDELFICKRGDSKYTKSFCREHIGDFEVFTGTTIGSFAKIDTYVYDQPNLSYTTDGEHAGTVQILQGKYNVGGHRALLIPKVGDLDLYYMQYILRDKLKELKVKGSVPTVKWNDIKKLSVSIPVHSDQSFDLEKQKEIAEKYRTIEKIKVNINQMIKEILDVYV